MIILILSLTGLSVGVVLALPSNLVSILRCSGRRDHPQGTHVRPTTPPQLRANRLRVRRWSATMQPSC